MSEIRGRDLETKALPITYYNCALCLVGFTWGAWVGNSKFSLLYRSSSLVPVKQDRKFPGYLCTSAPLHLLYIAFQPAPARACPRLPAARRPRAARILSD